MVHSHTVHSEGYSMYIARVCFAREPIKRAQTHTLTFKREDKGRVEVASMRQTFQPFF